MLLNRLYPRKWHLLAAVFCLPSTALLLYFVVAFSTSKDEDAFRDGVTVLSRAVPTYALIIVELFALFAYRKQ